VTPKDADTALLDPHRIRFACDPARNKAFSKADARTRDAHGKRTADYLVDGSHEETTAWLRTLIAKSPVAIRAELKNEPLKIIYLRKPDGRQRKIAIPTYRRRCIGNLVGRVILDAVQDQFPGSVRAYLPRKENAQHNAILDVAEAVADGRVKYFCKLDFKDYFWSVPPECVSRGVRYYGFSDWMVGIVEALLSTPGVVIRRGRTNHFDFRRGIAAGLTEAPVLANIAPYALDADLAENPRVLYLRWSDDIFIGGATREEIVGAVNKVRSWARSVGVGLKGVDPRMSSKKLVGDVYQGRILFLGMEIDHLGRIHIPRAKVTEKLVELRHMVEHPAVGRVEGLSTYAGGEGIEAYDDQDVWSVVGGCEDYWKPLDEPGTERFLALAGRTTMSPSGMPAGPGAVWAARLWLPQGREGGGVPPSRPGPEPLDQPLGDDPRAEANSNHQTHRAFGHVELEEPTEDEISIEGFSIWDREGPAGDSEGDHGNVEPPLYTDQPVDDEEVDEENSSQGDYASRGRSRSSSFYGSPDLDPPLGNLDQEEVEGARDGSDEGEPPALSDSEDVHVVYVGSRRLEDGRVLVGLQRGGGLPWGGVVHRTRAETAIVRLVTSYVRRSTGAVEVRMTPSWLAKGLVQSDRRFRSPHLFAALGHLHRAAAGRDVVVLGGVKVPETLREHLASFATDELTPTMHKQPGAHRDGVRP
jgi:hypothetical protein